MPMAAAASRQTRRIVVGSPARPFTLTGSEFHTTATIFTRNQSYDRHSVAEARKGDIRAIRCAFRPQTGSRSQVIGAVAD
jgi:hypothetical protein